MPSDLQLIDSFEHLREAFVRENASYQVATRQRPETTAAEAWVLESWIQAVEGKMAVSGAQQRRVRALARMIMEGRENREGGEEAEGIAATEDRKILARAERLRKGLALAAKKRFWPLAEHGPERPLSEEAREWGRLLPGLAGLRAWRLLERLGRPVIVPEAPLRRFLWRLGLFEEPPAGQSTGQKLHSLFEQLSALTGLAFPLLGTLLRWQTSGEKELAGGQWCTLKPRCADCPFRPGCTWARFHPAEPAAERPLTDREALEPLRRRIVAGRQDQLQETELLAVVLQRGGTEAGVFDLAEMLLRRFGGLRGLEHAAVAQLAQLKGISEGRATQLKAALELGRRLAAQAFQPGDPITCSGDVWRAYCSRFRHLPQEHFVIVLLDAKNRVIHDHIVSKGTLTGSLAHPREVFQEAIKHAAAGIILLHNHPSGDPKPSRDDQAVTTRLKEAGEILGIKVLDHIVLGAEGYYSFKDEGGI